MSKEYIELYKKYRPKAWNEIIGQDSVINTLIKAMKEDRVPTAYAFTGPHGCGKTSTALLFAKALNCDNVDENFNPCNECDTCKAIDTSSQPGVRYISAANNGNIDDVRKIIEESRLSQPVKKQVFIIDECHRISATAFDSWLIPLEDVRSKTLFIFCSTEPEKIPSTIKSRIQSRGFVTVPPQLLAANLHKIIKAEHFDVSIEQIKKIALSSNGSVRDSITNLEHLISGEELAEDYNVSLMKAILAGSYSEAFTVVNKMDEVGTDYVNAAQELYSDLVNVVVCQAGGESRGRGNTDEIAKAITPRTTIAIMRPVESMLKNMSTNIVSSKILFEVALVEIITIIRTAKGGK